MEKLVDRSLAGIGYVWDNYFALIGIHSENEQLKAEVESGAIDTVVVAFTDMQGRLMGKRLHGEFFVDEVGAGHPVEACNYLLALEMEMDPVPGYAIASWEQGYGDFAVRPDLATLRRIPWLEATALVLCDVEQLPSLIVRRLSVRRHSHVERNAPSLHRLLSFGCVPTLASAHSNA
jgi:hypothetical protein